MSQKNPSERANSSQQQVAELQERLHVSEANLALAQKVAHVGIWELDLSTLSMIWSEELYRIMGFEYHQTPLLLDEVMKSCHPDDEEMVRQGIKHSAATGEPLILNVRIIQPSGATRYLEVRGKALVDGQGQITRLFGTTLDITEHKQTTIALHQLNQELEQRVLKRTHQLQQQAERERLLRLITEQIRRSLDLDEILTSTVNAVWKAFQADRALIFRLNANGGSVVHKELVCPPYPAIANMGWEEEWFPVECHAYYLQCIPRIVPDTAKDDWGACLAEFMHSVGVKSKIVAPIIARQDDGSSRVWGLLTVHACSDYREWQHEEANFLQQIANQLAIALRQAHLYEAVQQQVEELKQLHLLKDDFLSTVSHELRSPMSNIKMATQMLELRLKRMAILDVKSGLQRYVQILKDECQREINLINDLLDLARLEAGFESINPTAIDLITWMPTVVTDALIERTCMQRQRLCLDLPSNLPCLNTDPNHLERILMELLHNACKYTPAGEKITITAKVVGAGVEEKQTGSNNLQIVAKNPCSAPTPTDPDAMFISVINTGVEIPKSERDRIFDKFYRVLNNDPWKHGGTGLGLALVKKLAESLGATIQVESEARQTAFILQLPIEHFS